MRITQARIIKRTLQFKFEAGTSRGVLKEKPTWYLVLYHNDQSIGIGEAGPLAGLSVEKLDNMPQELERVAGQLAGIALPETIEEVFELAKSVTSYDFPSIQFAVETALLDALHHGEKVIFPTDFVRSNKRIPINGLVWMGEEQFMKAQIASKLSDGFTCIKMKIGAINFEKEIELLSSIRKQYTKEKITLRVDANGAFSVESVESKLQQLLALNIHSIEQPIKAGQHEAMKALCQLPAIPIALDEELIGIRHKEEKIALLNTIKPQYIILKPSLIGGIAATLEWVQIAESLNIGWWMTSMLESNIGLNAICQLADYLQVQIPQGLGTGQLYHNNIDSPLTIEKGEIYYDQNKNWGEV